MDDDQQLVQFYREVLMRRERLKRLEGEEGEAPVVVEECTTDVNQWVPFFSVDLVESAES